MNELFEYPPTRSNRVKWALEELGIEYTSHQVDFMQGKLRDAAHRSIHPLGHVPAYRTDTFTMHESVAIVLQLLDDHPDVGLAPDIGDPKRAIYYQWCVFAASELDHNLFNYMKHTMHLSKEQRSEEIAIMSKQNFTERAVALCDALSSNDYLLGSEFASPGIYQTPILQAPGSCDRPIPESTSISSAIP